jgi:hypothetical protein
MQPPFSQRPKGGRKLLKVLLWVAGTGFALLGAAFAALLVWSCRGIDLAEEAEARGVVFGKSVTDADCFATARAELKGGYVGHFAIPESGFVRGCLTTAAPTSRLCEGVPLPSDEEAAVLWYEERCGSSKTEAGLMCGILLQQVQYHCLERMAKR